MVLQFKNTKSFTTLLENIKNVSDTITFYFENNGITIQTMDSSLISCLTVRIPEECFEIFEIEQEVMTVLISSFLEMLSFCDEDLILDIQQDKLILKSNDNVFELIMLEIDVERMVLPTDLVFDYIYTIDTPIWKERCKKILKFSPNIELNLRQNCIGFTFKNDTISGRLKTVVEATQFGDDYTFGISLVHICKVFIPTDSLNIMTCRNMPFMMSYKYNEMDILYFVAPRIQE